MIVREIYEKIIPEIEKSIAERLLNGSSFSELAATVHDWVNKIGIKILEQIVEDADKAFIDSAERKRHWQIVRKDKRGILTGMGQVNISRNYYRHKKTGKYAYLADEVLKLPTYDRVDEGLKADLIVKASGMSYSKAGKANPYAEVSRQTVMNCIREAGTLIYVPEDSQKKAVPVLYVEADEDHVAHQDGQNRQAKLVYVHEGAKRNGKRCDLQNVHYFATTKTDNETLWTEVLDYIERTYDVERIERIYVAGDGAGWIKAGQSYLPKSVSILDSYHRNKYVRKVASGDELQMRRLVDALRAGDRSATANELKSCYEKAETEGQRKKVLEVRRYLFDNWKSIENATKYPDVIGCSAEGHVSHILSERLSSRPMGWSITGSEQMSRLRAFIFNGGDVNKTLKKPFENKLRLPKRTVSNIRKRVMKGFENIGNIPVLRMCGRTSRTYLTLRGIQHGSLLY
ncbi:MAG TPA: ISLre2 family transposase [Clostridiaceae bacterium]|nr:ISLre2 family transposase [Clostridiaceae bacterium]